MDQTENQQTVARTKVGLNNLPAVGRGEGTNSHRNGSVTRWLNGSKFGYFIRKENGTIANF